MGNIESLFNMANTASSVIRHKKLYWACCPVACYSNDFLATQLQFNADVMYDSIHDMLYEWYKVAGNGLFKQEDYLTFVEKYSSTFEHVFRGLPDCSAIAYKYSCFVMSIFSCLIKWIGRLSTDDLLFVDSVSSTLSVFTDGLNAPPKDISGNDLYLCDGDDFREYMSSILPMVKDRSIIDVLDDILSYITKRTSDEFVESVMLFCYEAVVSGVITDDMLPEFGSSSPFKCVTNTVPYNINYILNQVKKIMFNTYGSFMRMNDVVDCSASMLYTLVVICFHMTVSVFGFKG